MSEMGEFYWVEAFLMVVGLVFLVVKRERKKLILLSVWILVAPLASAITGGPHALRSAFLLPPLILLSATGVVEGLSLLPKRRLIILGLMTLWFFQFTLYLERVYFLAPQKHGRFWSEMAKTVSLVTMEQKEKYDLILQEAVYRNPQIDITDKVIRHLAGEAGNGKDAK